MNAHLKRHSLINVTYVFKEEEITIKFDEANNISLFINIIELTKKIKFRDYDLNHRKEKVEQWQYEKTMKEIIKQDSSPVFFILRKGEKLDMGIVMESPHVKNEQEVKKKEINLHANQVVIENFQSRMEVYMILKKYLDSINKINKPKNEYIAETNKTNDKITFTFNKAVKNIEFLIK